jgi:hypothetical protein
MSVKLVSAVVAVVLMIGYLAPIVFKLKEVALGAVVLIGIGMMLVDLWQSLQKREE